MGKSISWRVGDWARKGLRQPITEGMKRFRPLRTFGATLAAVVALVVLGYAIQDLWHYWQNLSAGYTAWVASGQGWWQLTCGVAETIATGGLMFVSGRLLGTKLRRTVGSS